MVKRFLYATVLLNIFLVGPSFAADGDRVIEGITADKVSTVNMDVTGVTDGNLPYMQAAGAGFGDSPIWTDGTNVGIGTNSPGVKLYIDSSDYILVSLESNSAIYTGLSLINNDVSSRQWIIGANSNGATYGPAKGFIIRDFSSSQTRFSIDGNGNIGINTATPTARLDVKTSTNDGSTNGFLVEDSDGTTIFAINSDGLVRGSVTAGIVAASPGNQGDGQLVSAINEISVVGAANDAVTLPPAEAGRICRIINNGANTLEIWPESGDNAGAGIDTAVTLAAGSNATYVAYDSINWEKF